LDEYCTGLQEKGIKVIIAGAGLAAALPGVIAAKTTIPVVGVPLVVGSLDGLDALMSIVQMPPGIPVGTMALGKPGAINAALFAAAILALTDASIADRISAYREKQAQKILESELD
jgi:5-(carboxyamino)imidazole ribonucleotide mutase